MISLLLFGPTVAMADVILSVSTMGNEVIGGESFFVDVALDFEGSDAQLAVVAGNIATTPNVSFTGFTVVPPALVANEADFNVAFFYPFPNLLSGVGQVSIATLEFEAMEVQNDSFDSVTISFAGGGGFFFDRVANVPSATDQSLNLRVLASSVPEPSNSSLALLVLASFAMRRRMSYSQLF